MINDESFVNIMSLFYRKKLERNDFVFIQGNHNFYQLQNIHYSFVVLQENAFMSL